MTLEKYEEVLKQLDRWAEEARAISRTKTCLDDKLQFIRFHDVLRDTRAKLRLHYFDAEDASKYVFTTKLEWGQLQETILSAQEEHK